MGSHVLRQSQLFTYQCIYKWAVRKRLKWLWLKKQASVEWGKKMAESGAANHIAAVHSNYNLIN